MGMASSVRFVDRMRKVMDGDPSSSYVRLDDFPPLGLASTRSHAETSA